MEMKNVTMNDCVTLLGQSSGAVYNYLIQNRDNMEYFNYYHFFLSPLPLELIEEEPILKRIHNRFPIEGMGISKFFPYTNHRWHKDTDRGLSINMLLEHQRSHVLFRYPDPYNDQKIVGCQRIHEVNYEPNKFYLFNTQEEHTISNYEGDRYTFIMKFKQNKDEIDYYQVKEYYESL